ncbi:HAD family phosphatase [Streptomyces sp. NPDC002599]|uniref:HAD family phosphatase n=1 Tax=Streptomyces sp. NPDC002599 TaxID=3154421 RepID=UPI00332F7721
MPAVLQTLRLAAVNIDGVLLSDTFSPVIHRFVTAYGVAYTAELERAVLSQPRDVAARALARATGARGGVGQTVRAYFAERERYLREHPVRVNEGALELVGRLRGLGLEVVCYGGLGQGHFERHLGSWRACFTAPGYICTDGFRPGIKEIARCFGLGLAQVLFVDDAARFAEHARQARAPFIGHPSAFRHGFQRRAMREIGVRHLVDRLDAVDEALLRTVDAEAGRDGVWGPQGPRGGREEVWSADGVWSAREVWPADGGRLAGAGAGAGCVKGAV